MRKATTVTYNRDYLLNELADDFRGVLDKKTLTDVLNQLEYHINSHLQEARPQKNIILRPFLGVQFLSWVEPEKTVSFGEEKSFAVDEHIRLRAKFTPYHSKCINTHQY